MSDRAAAIPRLVPERALPPYSYVPGLFPHPNSDPRGHSYGVEPERPEPPDPAHWQLCRAYLYGIDLFNHGYYWEAHEVWESLWHACGKSGLTGDFLKALIKLAAAGVKVREGKAEGVRSHANRAAELFEQTARDTGPRFMGLSLLALSNFARSIAEQPPSVSSSKEAKIEVVFAVELLPT